MYVQLYMYFQMQSRICVGSFDSYLVNGRANWGI